MSDYNSGNYKPALVLGAIIFVVAFAMLLILGDYGFIAGFFLALLLALLSAIVIYLAFGVGDSAHGGFDAGAAPASAKEKAGSGEEAANHAVPETAQAAEQARRAADAEAAREEAEAKAEADRKAAEAKAEADRRDAEAKAEADRKAEEARRAANAGASTSTSATGMGSGAAATASSSGDRGEDYDGDGVHEGVNEGTRPAGLDGPRGGVADDLKMIKGVGPKLEKVCNSLGFWHFDQVAAWSADEVAWVDANLTGFKGRVSRDAWVEQARTLAAGGETEFSKRVEGGDVY